MNRTLRVVNGGVHTMWRWLDRVGQIVPGTHAAEQFGSFGAGSCLSFPPATLLNTGSIHIGSDTLIGRQATLSVGYGVGPVPLPPRGLVIGDRCSLGARVSITAHESIEIGDGVFFGQSVFVTDASHGYQDPTRPIGKQFGQHQPVSIGSGSWIGHGAVILPGTRIGRNVVVAASTVVRGEIEDFAVVAGNPARVVRRLEPDVGWVDSRGGIRPVLDTEFGLERPASALP